MSQKNMRSKDLPRGEMTPPLLNILFRQIEELKTYILSCLLNVRRELENVLYACYLYYTKCTLDEYLKRDKKNEEIKKLINFLQESRTIFLNPRIIREISYIISNLNAENFIWNETLLKILKPEYEVYLSRFAHECLNSFNQMSDLSTLYVKMNTFLKRKIIKDQLTESNYKKELLKIQFEALDELEKMNNNSIPTFPLKSEVDLITSLDTIFKKKLLKNQNIVPGSQPQKKIKKNETYLLSEEQKNMVFLSESLKDHTDSANIPIPEISLVDKISFCQNYLDRKIINETVQPSIFQMKIKDPDDTITCIEIGHNHNVVICGTMESLIICYILNPNFFPSEIKAVNESEKNALQYFKLNGHESAITSISILYDELYFLSGSVDTTVMLWCMRQKTCLSIYKAHLNTIWRVKFSPKGYYFASGSSDCTAKLWTIDKSSPVRTFLGHNSDVNVIEFLSNCLYLVTAGNDCKVIFWEISSGNRVKILFHFQEIVTAISISFSGLYMATASEEGSVIFWDLTKFMKINCFYPEKESYSNTVNINGKKYKINHIGFNVGESYLMCVSKKRISYYLVKNLKEKKNEDIYAGYLSDDNEIEENEVQPINFFDNKNSEAFQIALFHEKNSILLVSKSYI